MFRYFFDFFSLISYIFSFYNSYQELGLSH